MKYIKFFNWFLIIGSITIISCTTSTRSYESNYDSLPSWNESTTKTSIIQFVEEVTDPNSASFVPLHQRIAVFDNDGTLWSEQPNYFQYFFTLDRVKAMAAQHCEWASLQPFKAVLENDTEALKQSGDQGLTQLIMATHSGLPVDSFDVLVLNWLATAKHPRFNKPFTDLVYQPMLELINYLQANDFKTYIVSGSGIEFMRPWVESVYGIPKNQVIGSALKTELHYVNKSPVIVSLPEVDVYNDKQVKPLSINKIIGRKPILCVGNSDGDLDMMQWTASGNGQRLMLYVHHTDSVREWAYDRLSPIGKLDKGLDVALKNRWTVIDMALDWKLIYPFELDTTE